MTADIIIIGGGIIGLSTAYKLTQANPSLKILVIEKEVAVARHQTGNNSGVIHSGIYYRPGSLKAENCIRGYTMLLDFVKEHDIPFDLCGKIIVATDEQELPGMEDLYQRGIQNGLNQIKKIDRVEVKQIEPHVRSVGGIHVPYTGITDYTLICHKLQELITSNKNSNVLCGEKVQNIEYQDSMVKLTTNKASYLSGLVINTGGLFSDRIASLSMDNLPYRIIPFRGEYYKLADNKKYLVKNLVYPVPDPEFPFLGVHFTRMIDGNTEAGPNAVFAFKREGYKKTSFSLKDTWASLSWPGMQKLMYAHFKMGIGEFYRSYNKAAFTRALQKLIPEIRSRDLVPGGAGVRAQACDRNGKLIDDFVIMEKENIINVLNAPSPAATASLSIGQTIAEKAISKI